jgi:hypothetical protein
VLRTRRPRARHAGRTWFNHVTCRRTVTLLATREGPTLVAGGATDLEAAQIQLALRRGLTPVAPMPGVHAELTALETAGALGLTPTRGVTTNVICPACRELIEQAGGQILADRIYGFPPQ